MLFCIARKDLERTYHIRLAEITSVSQAFPKHFEQNLFIKGLPSQKKNIWRRTIYQTIYEQLYTVYKPETNPTVTFS